MKKNLIFAIFLIIFLFACSTTESNIINTQTEQEKNEKIESTSVKMVKIPKKEFKMDITEVTNKEYNKCMAAGVCENPHYFDKECYILDGLDLNKGIVSVEFTQDNKPVVCVTLKQAITYCKWAGKRLPSKEQSIYSAKGGENYKYAGSDNPDEVAWYLDNSENKTHNAGTKKANGYGLYDMSGNVSEWTSDFNYLSTEALFGGNFTNYDKFILVDSLTYAYPENKGNYVGFRCMQYVK